MNLITKNLRRIKSMLIYERIIVAPLDPRIENFIKIIDEGYGNKTSSIDRKSVTASREPIPWFTYPCIEYLNQLDLKEKSILEWGIGNSTLYFAKRCKRIISIEHNKEWYDIITHNLPDNSKGYLVNEEEYPNYPKKLNEKFDIIIVDGIKRFDCIRTGVDVLDTGGMIIFDNSDRNPEYCQFLRKQNLIQIDFHGFGPIVNFTTTTSIFLTREVNFEPLTVQPLIPIGGGY